MKEFSKSQLEDLARVEILIRHARNMNMPELGPQVVQMEAMYTAGDAFKRAIGSKNYENIFKTKTWKTAIKGSEGIACLLDRKWDFRKGNQ